MKKMLCVFITLVLVISLGACGKSGSQAETTAGAQTEAATQASTEEFTWTREGYFMDGNENMLSITPSDDSENPGWYVGAMIGDDMYGWYIQQEGKALHGDIASPDIEDSEPFVVTITEEGEDGIKMETEAGQVYKFKLYDIADAAFAVSINVERDGQIAYAEGETIPEFDDEYPSQSAYIGLEKAEVYTFAAKPDHGFKFIKWTNFGEDYSTEPIITVEVTDNMDLVAVFGIKGTNEAHVDLDKVETMGELMGLPDYGYSTYGSRFIYAFEQDGMYYQAVAEMPEDVAEKFAALDFSDDSFHEKMAGIVSPLKVTSIRNLSEEEPAQEALDALIGKTGKELFDDGWTNSGWNLDTMEFYMDHGPFGYILTMDGDIGNTEDFSEEDIEKLTVIDVEYNGITDMTYLEDGE
ncbi:MAG: hypothetical protein II627_02475 [Lachnospiraceae bacterium]|nr:hypothetical protein [Lachnospiraceae bacterium]